jgi:hypothetical protein
MRTADPTAYDQFIEVTGRTADGTKFIDGFRGFFVTTSASGRVTLNIQQIVNGALATAKTMDVYLSANSSIVVPMSGETVFCSNVTSGFKVYALI